MYKVTIKNKEGWATGILTSKHTGKGKFLDEFATEYEVAIHKAVIKHFGLKAYFMGHNGQVLGQGTIIKELTQKQTNMGHCNVIAHVFVDIE